MTINKSQSQWSQKLSLCLHSEIFAHDQLYVTSSQAISKAELFIVVPSDLGRGLPDRPTRCIGNKVIEQILLPVQD